MTTILDNLSKHPDRINRRIEEYSKFAADAVSFFDMDNKRLESICKDHAKNVYETSRRISEMKAMEEYYSTIVGEIESIHWRKYNENHKRTLSTRDIQAYIAGEPDFVAAKQMGLEICFVRNQLEHVLDALNGMSFMINNITKIRVSELEEVIL